MGAQPEPNARRGRGRAEAACVLAAVLLSLPLAGCATNERTAWRWPWEGPKSREIALRVHLADIVPVAGFQEHLDEYGQPVYVRPEPIATERHVVFAEALHSDVRSVLVLRFDFVTAGELEAATEDNVGKRLAVFIDDEYAVSAIIVGPVTEGGLALDIGLPREEVEAIVRGFAQRERAADEHAGP